MSFVKNWWTTDYAEDIFKYFLWKESMTSFRGRSPQLCERRRLVDMVRLVGEKLRLGNTSVHLAVRLLDIFMDNHRVEVAHLSLVALGCLLLATKFEDRNCNVPQPPELQLLVPLHHHPICDYVAVEAILLEFFDWNVSLVTVAHFGEFLATRVLRADDTLRASPGLWSASPTVECRRSAVRLQLLHYLHYFMDVALQDEHYLLCYRPSLVAAACLLAARSWLGVWPSWPADLAHLTGYSDIGLFTCMHALIRSLYADRVDDSPDSDSALDD